LSFFFRPAPKFLSDAAPPPSPRITSWKIVDGRFLFPTWCHSFSLDDFQVLFSFRPGSFRTVTFPLVAQQSILYSIFVANICVPLQSPRPRRHVLPTAPPWRSRFTKKSVVGNAQNRHRFFPDHAHSPLLAADRGTFPPTRLFLFYFPLRLAPPDFHADKCTDFFFFPPALWASRSSVLFLRNGSFCFKTRSHTPPCPGTKISFLFFSQRACFPKSN